MKKQPPLTQATYHALEVAVMYAVLYAESNPDVGIGPGPEVHVDDVLKDANLTIPPLQRDFLIEIAKKYMRGYE